VSAPTDFGATAFHERRRTAWLVGVVALAIRLLYLASHARSPLFLVTVLDARGHELAARGLAAGVLPDAWTTGFRPLLYPLLLAPIFRLADAGAVVAAQLVQHGLGVATALGVAVLGRRLFADEASARAAGLLYALAPVPLWLEGELLGEAVFLAVTTAFLLVAARERPPGDGRAVGAGVLFSVSARLRPNAGLLLVALPFGLAVRRWRRTLAIGAMAAVAGWLALMAVEGTVGGSLRPWPTAGGPNLYLGNRRGADGLVPRQPFAVAHGEAYRDSVELWASEDASVGSSQGWLHRAFDEVVADPSGRLALLGRKALVLLWNGEVPNNRSFAFVGREETPWLPWLPGRFGVLLAFGVAGWLAAGRGPLRTWLTLELAAQGASVVLFFVGDRLRAPLLLPLAVFAGGGLVALARRLVERRPRGLARLGVPALVAALLSFVDWTGAAAELPGPGRDLHFRSIAAFELGDLDLAESDARRALELSPGAVGLRAHLGAILVEQERLDEAEAELRRALAATPDDPRARTALGVVRERQGAWDDAAALYRQALESSPEYAPARIDAAWLALRSGDDAVAMRLLDGLAPESTNTFRALLARSEAARRRGDVVTATRLRREAERRDAGLASRLLEELATPLQRPSRK